jgi:signal transduction histidine kinase/ligand-binding sensor domain-containing protein
LAEVLLNLEVQPNITGKMFLQIRNIVFFFVYFFATSFSSSSQTAARDNYAVSFLTTQDGLSQASNNFMLQDSKGYMWISSQDGINRYNGNEFFHFNDPKYYKKCTPFKQAFGLVADVFGDLWMGSAKGLYRYSQSKNVFENFEVFSRNKESNNVVLAFAAIGSEIWVTDGKSKFASIDCKTYKVKSLFEAPAKLEINRLTEHLPVVDKKLQIWLTSGNQLYRFNPADKSVYVFDLSLSGPNAPADFEVTGISLQENKQLLGIATNKGFILFDIVKQQQVNVNDPAKFIVNENVWCVKADKEGFLVSSALHPLLKISTDGKNISALVDKKVLDYESNRGSFITAISVDKWGRVWLNSTGEYIAILDFAPSFMKKVTKSAINGLPYGTLISIANTDSSIWVSDSHLSEIDRASGRIKKTFSPADLPDKPTSGIGQLFYDSSAKRIWLNVSNKIYYYDLLMQKFFKTKYEFLGSAFLNDITRCFVKLSSGELLDVTQKGIFNLTADGVTVNLLQGIATDAPIYHLAELPGNRVAVSYKSGPIKIFRKEANLKFTELASIAADETTCMVFEQNGIIWAANSTGLYKIDGTSYKTLKKYTVKDGMANDCINAAQVDKFGWIWCSTNKGIVTINTADNKIQNFGMNQNLQDLEFNARAFDSDKDGYIYFGGVKGLNYFKPPHTDIDTIQPRLVIENISLNNSSYKNDINPDDVNEISYKYGTASLAIKVEALHLIKARYLKIKYRLNGLQNAWVEIKNGEQIQMFNLAAGKYTLEISYADGAGGKGFPIRILHINVLPPWYNTWWFYCIAGGLIITAIVLLVSYQQKQKLRHLKSENEIMKLNAAKDSIVQNERDRITADLHDDVGATLSSMHIYGDLAHSVWDTQPGQSKEMVGKISSQSKELMARMSDIVWSLKPAGQEKNALTLRLKNYTQELLAVKGIAAGFNIDEVIAAAIVNPLARKNILLIAKEAINNIAKYSEARQATFILNQENENIQLIISDDGKGYDKANTKAGNGLGNMAQRCKQLNGNCAIAAATGKGVTITCTFPLTIISHSS